MAKAVTVIFAGDTKDFSRAVGDVDRETSRLSDGIKKAGIAAVAGLAVAGAAAVKFGKASSDAYLEAKAGALQTNAVIKSTGGTAKVTATDVDTLTAALSRKAKVDDDEIRAGTNLLLTFTNIRNEAGKGNDVFNQTNAVMLDMAAAMGTDAKGGAIQLGKALNDPVAGISALTRVGVTFTSEQKALIKTLVDSGDLMGAQKIILAELNKEFGGSAAAAAAAKGPMADVALALDTVQTSVGKVMHESFLPGLIKGFTGGKDSGKTLAETAELIGKKIEEAGPKIAKWAEEVGTKVRGLAENVATLAAGADRLFNILQKVNSLGGLLDTKHHILDKNKDGRVDRKDDYYGTPFTSGGKATGGPVSGPVLVGENGPEIFDPRGSGSVLPRSAFAGSSGGGTTVVVQIDGRDLAAHMQTYQVRNGIRNSGSGIPA